MMKPNCFKTLFAMIILFMAFGMIQTSCAQDQLYTKTDKPPLYPGGSIAMAKFLKANVQYPAEAQKANITGTVTVSFVVELSGNLTKVEVTSGLGGGCDTEAIRVVKKMPKWLPGSVKGQAVRSVYKVNIKFPQP
jgi:periplasmic protein TonB